jgi:hypothetical protein
LTVPLLAGCASVSKDYPRAESTASHDYLDTRVGQLFAEAAQQRPGESGFAIIRHGRQAFAGRIALAGSCPGRMFVLSGMSALECLPAMLVHTVSVVRTEPKVLRPPMPIVNSPDETVIRAVLVSRY